MKIIFLALLLFPAAAARAEDSVWNQAFPGVLPSVAAQRTQIVLGQLELGVGGVSLYLAREGHALGRSAEVSPAELLELTARESALAELKISDPPAAALVREKAQLEKIYVGFNVPVEPGGPITGNDAPAVHEEFTRRNAALAIHEPELRVAEKKIQTRATQILADLDIGLPVPAPVEHTAVFLKDYRLGMKIRVAFSAGLVADGGLRLLALLTARDPGYSPVVSLGRALAQRAAPAEPERTAENAK